MSTQVANIQPATPKRSILAKMAERFNVEPDKMLASLKETAFKSDKAISNEQMIALLIVADQFGLNPWTKEIYAFPDRGGIVPVVGVDGWSRIINTNDQFDGMEFKQDDESCTCTIYRKDRKHPVSVTEYLSECARGTAPWKSHPKRMLRHKAMIQCARLAFGFGGIYDQDEAERIVERDITGEAELIEVGDTKTESVKGKLAKKAAAKAPEPSTVTTTGSSDNSDFTEAEIEESRRVDAEIAAQESGKDYAAASKGE